LHSLDHPVQMGWVHARKGLATTQEIKRQ